MANEKHDNKTDDSPAKKPRRGQELFAENFEPYRDDLTEPTSRGDDLSTIEKMEIAYWNKNYGEVVTLFEELPPTMKQNDNLRFMQANAMLAGGKMNQGAVILSDIIRNEKSKFIAEAHWYLALAYLKNDDSVNARKHLEAYIGLNGIKHKAQAEKILTEIR
jgi:predicted Zn-dependent protease